jgi:hypothetical protein
VALKDGEFGGEGRGFLRSKTSKVRACMKIARKDPGIFCGFQKGEEAKCEWPWFSFYVPSMSLPTCAASPILEM